MGKTVDYYMHAGIAMDLPGPRSVRGAVPPARRDRAHLKPIDLGKVFPVSGGLPLPKRAPQRQAYRLVELARWRRFLNLPLNVQPKFGASGPELATRFILAAGESRRGQRAGAGRRGDARALGRGARHRRPVDAGGDRGGTGAGRRGAGMRGPLRRTSRRASTPARRRRSTPRSSVCPGTSVDGEPFWGQDRLDFLARKLAK